MNFSRGSRVIVTFIAASQKQRRCVVAAAAVGRRTKRPEPESPNKAVCSLLLCGVQFGIMSVFAVVFFLVLVITHMSEGVVGV